MPGPPPKSSKTRQRRNKTSTRAKLRIAGEPPKAPELPEIADRIWDRMTILWWRSVWASPMAAEFVEADHHGLFKLALLEDDYWKAKSPTARKELASEIRLQRQCFGLTPLDRRRLQWEVEKVEDAQDKGRKRRRQPSSGKATSDPRRHLSAVK